MGFNDYVDWFAGCIKCDVCKDFIYGKNDRRRKGFICNDNIDKERLGKRSYPIKPQAGYIDGDWFDSSSNVIRILFLGQNPRDGYKEDDPLYQIYDDIIHGSDSKETIREITCAIKEQVKAYNPTSLLQPGISEIFSPKKIVFAYANQILCRTKPEASRISKMVSFENVYGNCFNHNIKPLIKIINPDYIIALGTTWEWQFKIYYTENNYRIVRHPSHGGKTKALEQIKVFVENMNL